MRARRLLAALVLVALVGIACSDNLDLPPSSTTSSRADDSTSSSDGGTSVTTSTSTDVTTASTVPRDPDRGSDLSVAVVRRGGLPTDGQPTQIDFVVVNLGPEPATDVELAVVGTGDVSAAGRTCDAATCTIGSLGTGRSVTVSARVIATTAPQDVVATVRGTNDDPDDTNQSAAITIKAQGTRVLVTTRLVVTPAFVTVKPTELGAVVTGLHATLLDETGLPVRDGRVEFTIGGNPVCGDDTDAHGEATCTTDDVPVALLTSLVYRATFVPAAEGSRYSGSFAVGPILK